MLDETLKVEKREGMEFPPLPKDIYQVELLEVNSEDRPTFDTRNNPPDAQDIETVLEFQYTILDGVDGEKSLRGRNIWAKFIPNYLYISKKSGKNKLYRTVEALLGRNLTEEEAATLDGKFLNSLIGKQCRLSIEPKKSGDKTFDTVADWLKANTVLPALTDEEKEKARVKNKSKEVKVEDIAF